MRLVFEGFERAIDIEPGMTRILEVENRRLFTRVCRTLMSGDRDAFEAFSVWDDEGGELNPSSAFLMVSDPLHFPWDDKRLGGNLPSVMEGLLYEDEEVRREIEGLGRRLSGLVASLTYQVHGDYKFALEWGIRQYLKSFSFCVDRYEGESFLESCISFLDFVADMGFKQALVFVNLKSFLTKEDLTALYDRVFFLNLRVLMLESAHDEVYYRHEKKTWLDQHFLES